VITLTDYWQSRDKAYPAELTEAIRMAAADTVAKANLLISSFRMLTKDTEHRKVNSGWRPAAVNKATAGAAPRSKHMTGQAIDISDPDGDLDDWCMEHPEVLQTIGLWLEHPSATKGWTHLQTCPPKSGKRIFHP
jgi:LAS superfamily LD-carboxypeptidase LdcB